MAGPLLQPAGGAGKTHGITVQLPNIPLWVPEENRAVINDQVADTLRLALQLTAGYISDEAPVDTGGLAQSFGADPATATGGIELMGVDTQAGITGRVFSNLPQAIVMNDGRRPGAPISRAGIDAIGLWAQRKLGMSASEAEGAKWAIANSIVAKGIVGTGYFEKGVKSAEPKVEAMFNLLAQEIATALLTREGGR